MTDLHAALQARITGLKEQLAQTNKERDEQRLARLVAENELEHAHERLRQKGQSSDPAPLPLQYALRNSSHGPIQGAWVNHRGRWLHILVDGGGGTDLQTENRMWAWLLRHLDEGAGQDVGDIGRVVMPDRLYGVECDGTVLLSASLPSELVTTAYRSLRPRQPRSIGTVGRALVLASLPAALAARTVREWLIGAQTAASSAAAGAATAAMPAAAAAAISTAAACAPPAADTALERSGAQVQEVRSRTPSPTTGLRSTRRADLVLRLPARGDDEADRVEPSRAHAKTTAPRTAPPAAPPPAPSVSRDPEPVKTSSTEPVATVPDPADGELVTPLPAPVDETSGPGGQDTSPGTGGLDEPADEPVGGTDHPATEDGRPASTVPYIPPVGELAVQTDTVSVAFTSVTLTGTLF